jgi:hypothetical protein
MIPEVLRLRDFRLLFGVGPIELAVGVKQTLLGAFALTMISSLTLLLIPDMWRVTSDGAPAQPRVAPDEAGGAEIRSAAVSSVSESAGG